MAEWSSWFALVGGVLAVVGQFYTTMWLAGIGGILAVVGALGAMSAK